MLLFWLACSTSAPEPSAAPPAPAAQPKAVEDDGELLEALGYVDGTEDEDESEGVVLHDRERAWQGLNFYASRKQSRAQLLDMDGKVLHTWKGPKTTGWQHVTLLPDGDLLVLEKDKQLFRIDKDSKLLWTFRARVHHDLDVAPDGTIWVLARRFVERPRLHPRRTVEDYVQVLSADGEPLREISVLDALLDSPYAFLVNDSDALTAIHYDDTHRKMQKPYDVLHTNHLELLDGTAADKNPAFRAGNLLLNTRITETPFVLDPETREIEWLWGTSALMYPHHPTVTPEGTVLIFNNGVEETGSQILEVDPGTNDIVWAYGPEKHFFSAYRGSNQRLPNGNTLITESDTGYVFEVDPKGETVWEFRNPHRKGRRRKQVRMAIWRMTRFAPDALDFPFAGDDEEADEPEDAETEGDEADEAASG